MAHMRPLGSEDPSRNVRTLCMYLNNNAITRLPLELFSLQGLAVLNLREHLVYLSLTNI